MEPSHPKSHSPKERRLEEKGGEPLHRERGTEHVADRPGVGRPVHAELELLDQAGDDADRDVDDQQRPEEPGQPEVLVAAGPVPGGLQHGGEEREADGHRHEQKR